jgi:hypothetical protein
MGTYNPPVDQLLKRGDPHKGSGKIDYPALGIGPEHVPDLIRMLKDKELYNTEPEWYAQIHAWRALGQLKAPEAVEPLLDVIDENEAAGDNWSDWVVEELPEVLGSFGPVILPNVVARIERWKGHYAATSFANVLVQLAQQHPDSRAEVIAQLCCALETAATNDPALNGFLIADFEDLRATEAWPTIEAAFATGHVDESIAGDVNDVKYRLGLSTEPGEYTRRSLQARHSLPSSQQPHPSGQNAKQRFNERQRKKKLEKKKNKKNRK